MGGSIIKIFSLIELNDLWSKKICWPQMIVWSVATFILRWSCYKYILILTGKPLCPATTSMTLLTRLTRLKRQHAKFWSRQDLQENFVQELKHNHIMNMSNYLVLLSIFLLFSIKHILTQRHYYRKIQTMHFQWPRGDQECTIISIVRQTTYFILLIFLLFFLSNPEYSIKMVNVVFSAHIQRQRGCCYYCFQFIEWWKCKNM